MRQSSGDFTVNLDAQMFQTKKVNDECTQNDGDQCSRDLLYYFRSHEKHDKSAQPHGKGGPICHSKFRNEFEQSRQNSAPFDRKAKYLADLAEDDAKCNTVQKADQNRFREEVGNRAEA